MLDKDGLLPYAPDAMQIPELAVLNLVKPPLPALAHRDEVVQSVRDNRVTILSGETGSGKTTQVPQFIIDSPGLVPEGMCVVVTQPRRIACMTIAERVAKERGQTVGEDVGYQIRFVNSTSPETKLIFCTTAVMLRKLHSDPQFDEVAVLCVDEVHERDVYTEFLLMAVRERMLRGEMRLKLVLMSATLSADTFTDFFRELRTATICGEGPDPDPESCVKIQGRMFPVKEAFLEDALEWTGHALPNAERVQLATVSTLEQRLRDERGRDFPEFVVRSLGAAGEKSVHLGLMKELVLLFHDTATRFKDKSRCGILVFLPGWADIQGLYHRLQGVPGLHPLMLHSNLSPEDQQRVFDDPPRGHRKVVLSTNIAETSVTIDDIVFVINSGVMKERVFDADRQLGALETSLCTWANVTQRAGRAGRTQEGVVVHLFPKWRMAELRQWPTPEILSKSLEEVVMQLLALGLGDPHEMLARSLSTPSVACIEHAVWLLQEMSMMNEKEGMSARDALTPMGRWLAPIPLHPMSSKALLYAALFGVLLPVTAMIAFLNIKSPFVAPVPGQAARGGKHLIVGDKRSDHYAMAAAYLSWRSRSCVGEGDSYINEHNLSHEALTMGDKMVKSLLRLMVDEYDYDGDDANFIEDAGTGSWTPEAVFDDPKTWQLCRAALCFAYTPQFVHCQAGKFLSDSNEEVAGHGSSVNQGYQPKGNMFAAIPGTPADDWLVYSDSMKLGKVSIMESTVVGAPAVLLAAKSFTPTTGRRVSGEVVFDGWRGTVVGGDATLRSLQSARGQIDQHLGGLMEEQRATTLPPAVLEDVSQLLAGGPRLALKNVVGIREPRIGAREAATMFVGNIPDEADEQQVRQLFEAFGTAQEVSLVVDHESGMRRGFGFVTMGSREEAVAASQGLNGAQLYGKRLRIDLKGAPPAGKGVAPTTFAKTAERRCWVREPTDEERQAMTDEMRAKALQNRDRAAASVRFTKDGATAEEKEAEASLFEARLAEAERQRREREAEGLSGVKEECKDEVADEQPPPQNFAAPVTTAAQAAKEERPDTAASGDAADQWAALLLDVARARVGKRKAVQSEDFAAAGRLKRQEADAAARLEEVKQRAMRSGGGLEEERSQLEAAKKRAVLSENFEEAGRLKKRLKVLEEQGPCAADPAQLAQSALDAALALAQQMGEQAAVAEELRALGGDLPPGASKVAAPSRPAAVKEEPSAPVATPSAASAAPAASAGAAAEQGFVECAVPGLSVQMLLGMANQDLWQHAWNVTWQKQDSLGLSTDQAQVYAQAQRVWKQWLAERERLGREQAAAEGRKKAEEILRKAKAEQAAKEETKVEQEATEEVAGRRYGAAVSAAVQAVAEERLPLEQRTLVGAAPRPQAQSAPSGGLTEEQLTSQEEQWQKDDVARKDWAKLTADVEKRRRAKEETPRSGRDLCALVKQRCPADLPLQFERLLAVCPKGTTVRQLVQAMAKEPQEFRQSWDGGEYCVRPVNSRCVDWLPVQATTAPPGFREDASLPEEMLSAAKCIFEERLKPVGNAAEDPLAQFLAGQGRLPADTGVPFEQVLKHCPPGTLPMDLIRTMSKRRDIFRQDPSGSLFCVRPRARCRDWPAVNPYVDPTKPKPAQSSTLINPSASSTQKGTGHADGDY